MLASMPSPHTVMHGLPGTRQAKPGSTVLQSFEQPSPLLVLPSSQASFEVRALLPQMALLTHGPPSGGQVWFASTWQMRLHPSPPVALPSSHCSFRKTTPSPQ